MYDCIIPLDIIMVDGDTIDTIHENCPICDNEMECNSYTGYGDKVLEEGSYANQRVRECRNALKDVERW